MEDGAVAAVVILMLFVIFVVVVIVLYRRGKLAFLENLACVSFLHGNLKIRFNCFRRSDTQGRSATQRDKDASSRTAKKDLSISSPIELQNCTLSLHSNDYFALREADTLYAVAGGSSVPMTTEAHSRYPQSKQSHNTLLVNSPSIYHQPNDVLGTTETLPMEKGNGDTSKVKVVTPHDVRQAPEKAAKKTDHCPKSLEVICHTAQGSDQDLFQPKSTGIYHILEPCSDWPAGTSTDNGTPIYQLAYQPASPTPSSASTAVAGKKKASALATTATYSTLGNLRGEKPAPLRADKNDGGDDENVYNHLQQDDPDALYAVAVKGPVKKAVIDEVYSHLGHTH